MEPQREKREGLLIVHVLVPHLFVACPPWDPLSLPFEVPWILQVRFSRFHGFSQVFIDFPNFQLLTNKSLKMRADPCCSTQNARGSMFFGPKCARIHVFLPKMRADPCFSTPKCARIHVFRPKMRADPRFSTQNAGGSLFFDPKCARIHFFKPN